MARKKIHELARGSALREVRDDEGHGSEPGPSMLPAEMTRIEQIELRRGPIPDAEELFRRAGVPGCTGDHPDGVPEPGGPPADDGKGRAGSRTQEQRCGHRKRAHRVGAALLIALVGFGCATYLVAAGHGVEEIVIFGLDVGALVSEFILGRPKLGATNA